MEHAALVSRAIGELSSGPVGQAAGANPWDVLPAIESKLASAGMSGSQRGELHALAALACGRLGLRTVGLEQLALAEAMETGYPAIRRLLESLVDDRIDCETRVSLCEQNLAALHAPPETLQALRDELPRWGEAATAETAFKTLSGAVVVRTRGSAAGWRLWLDDAALAHSVTQASLGSGPLYVDGVHAPLTLRAIINSTQRPRTEQQVRVVLLAPSARDMLEGLSLMDWRGAIAFPRVTAMIGPEVPARLAREFESRLAYILGQVVTIPKPPEVVGGPRWPRGAISEALARAARRQEARSEQSRSAVRARYSARDEAFWATRLARAGAGERPLRVLVLTARNSTVVQHGASDLAGAFAAKGIEVRVLIEPDECSRFTPLAIMSAIEDFDPDLVVLINNLRSQVREALPENLPVVTWIQDAMAHLFDRATGSALGRFDFVVGHLHPELFSHFGFPRDRCFYSPVLASDTKFHDGPVDARLRAEFECEIAYASHQSETPQILAARLLREAPADSWVTRVMPHLLPAVVRATEDADLQAPPLLETLRSISADAYRAGMGESPSPKAAALTYHTLAAPIAERALRQQMVGWAADVCEHRGWRLHLYGEGWSSNPRFARHARGVLHHGETLRAAYQCARLHLHAGLGGVHHQRVLECALSGGCTLVRIKKDDVYFLEWWAQHDLAMSANPSAFVPAFPELGELYVAPVADYWQSMMVHALYDRLGVAQQHPERGRQVVSGAQLREPWCERGGTPLPFRAAWLTGDLAESGFWSREPFERAAARLIESPDTRASRAAWQRRAAKDHFSLTNMAEQIIEMMRKAFSGRSAPQALDRRTLAEPAAEALLHVHPMR